MQGGNKNGFLPDTLSIQHTFPDFSGGLVGKGKDRGRIGIAVHPAAKPCNQGMGFTGTGSCLDKNMVG